MAISGIARFALAACLLESAALAQPGSAGELKAFNRALAELTGRLSPSVVQVSTTGFGAAPNSPSSQVRLQQGRASGVIVDPDGYILTNAHVVLGTNRVDVHVPVPQRDERGSILRPRGKIVPAQVVGIDRETDLALLKIEQGNLQPLAFGDSETVEQGQLALALGSPLGLDNSVSLGVVSAVARQLEPEDPVIYIQTDASINPGNSGGPLVDMEGNVIGINTSILSQSGGSEGVGFAIPSNIVRNVYEQLRKSGKVTRGEIGIEAQTISPGLAAALKLPRDQGVVLADVVPGRPADIGGLQIGDVVLTLDRKPMENARQLMVNLYSKPISWVAEIEVLRGAETMKKRVVILEREDDPGRFASLVRREANLVARLGILGLPLDPTVTAKLPGLRRTYGILVAALVRETSLLEAGDVIYEMNGKAISTLKELRDALDAIDQGGQFVLQVERDGRLHYIEYPVE